MKTKLRKRVQFETTGPSLTKQAFHDECDVNSILAKYAKTGHISHVRQGEGSYGDFTLDTDYQDSLNKVIIAQEAFMQLPAVVRRRFGNDPQQLMEFISDEKNYDEATQLGLISSEVLAQREKTNQTKNANVQNANPAENTNEPAST